VQRPAADQNKCREEKGGGRHDPRAPGEVEQERHEDEQEQDLVPRPDEDEHAEAGADEPESQRCRCSQHVHDEQRPQRKCRGEHAVGRELVEEDSVPRVCE
jgi:hypothetical protein